MEHLMDDTGLLIWSMIFGSIGLGFFLYGKKQRSVVPFAAGIALFIFPYFMPNLLVMLVVGTVICAIPYFVRY